MVLTVASAPKVGPVLVDPKGFTVYDFHKDKGTTSSCYGACAKVWPPVTTEGAPTAGEGAMSAKLGTTKRKDGTVQVTYAGHPLYTYVADKKPGEANGNDFSSFGAQWYALHANGGRGGRLGALAVGDRGRDELADLGQQPGRELARLLVGRAGRRPGRRSGRGAAAGAGSRSGPRSPRSRPG